MPEKLYMTPMGWSTKRPAANDALPPIDRKALLQGAHIVARRYQAACGGTYADAIKYGLTVAWRQWRVAHSVQSLAAQVTPREFTAAELAASRTATRRCGSSYLPM